MKKIILAVTLMAAMTGQAWAFYDCRYACKFSEDWQQCMINCGRP